LGRTGTAAEDGGHDGDLGRACREEEEGRREERKERGRERDGAGSLSLGRRAATTAAISSPDRRAGHCQAAACLNGGRGWLGEWWAGPWWASSCCAARQIRGRGGKDLGRTRPGEKEMDFIFYTLFSIFCFLVLNILLLFSNICWFRLYQKEINIYKGLQKLY
jgi:hypothetical protein